MLLIYFVIVIIIFPQFVLANEKGSSDENFEVVFQKDGGWSTDEWMEYKNEKQKIPFLNEFTTCYWDRLRYFSADYVSVWQYCGVDSISNKKMRCTQAYYRGNVNTAGRHMDLYGWIGGKFEVSVYTTKYRHRSWNHFCWSYSSLTGESRFYHNGFFVGNRTIEVIDGKYPTIEGDGNYEASAFIIGQEQDWVSGKYEASQMYSGEITELNMWDTILEPEKIESLASCKSFEKGNVIAWNKKNFKINKAKVVTTKDLRFLCKPPKKHIIFPEPLTLENAKIVCNAHGGKIATPVSAEENTELMEIVKQHKNRCMRNTNPVQQGRLIWLGLKQIDDVFYDVDYNKIIGLPKYENWDKYTPFYPNLGCAFMQIDGFWGFRDTATCNKIELCTICAFEETPVFNLKGLCKKNTALDSNYYMVTNSSNQITKYDGFSISKLTMRKGKWSARNKGVSIERPMAMHPLGRFMWTWYDRRCNVDRPQNRSLTLSVCEFGKQFTCDSGQCVPLQSRCDNINNCEDGSDESNCMLIQIPESYQIARFPIGEDKSSGAFPINTQLSIISFDRIDTVNMIIGITAEMRLTWKDRRLTFANLVEGQNEVPTKTADLLWLPIRTLIHENAVIGSMEKDSMPQLKVKISGGDTLPQQLSDSIENVLFLGENNPLELKVRFKIEYNCNFHLVKFPFDKQNCELISKMKIEKGSNITLVEDNPATAYGGSTTLNQFEITSITSKAINNEKETKFIVNIGLRRDHMNQMINTFFPTFMLWMLAYATLFIKLEDFGDRIMVTITALLVLASLLGSISEDLPTTSYFKFIDVWFLWYLINIFIITVYHILLDMVKDDEDDVIIHHHLNNGEKKGNQIIPITVQKDKEEKCKKCGNNGRKIGKEKINEMAIIIFPICTIIFNFVYFILSTL